ALQAGNSRSPLSRQEHSRSFEPYRQGGPALLLGRAKDCGEAARAGRSWLGIFAPWPVGNNAVWRRSAAHETGGAPSAQAARHWPLAGRAQQAPPAHAIPLRRTHNWPALRRRQQTFGGLPPINRGGGV